MFALVTTWSATVPAQDRGFAELEPATLHFAGGGVSRVTISTLGVTFGWGEGRLIPYVGGGLGLLAAQARAGLSFLPSGLASAGMLVRLEARPQVFLSPCLEPALFANVGLGYRWPLERSYPDVRAGAALYVLPLFDGGEAWLRPHCSGTGVAEPRVPKFMAGGTVAFGLDW